MSHARHYAFTYLKPVFLYLFGRDLIILIRMFFIDTFYENTMEMYCLDENSHLNNNVFAHN